MCQWISKNPESLKGDEYCWRWYWILEAQYQKLKNSKSKFAEKHHWNPENPVEPDEKVGLAGIKYSPSLEQIKHEGNSQSPF